MPQTDDWLTSVEGSDRQQASNDGRGPHSTAFEVHDMVLFSVEPTLSVRVHFEQLFEHTDVYRYASEPHERLG